MPITIRTSNGSATAGKAPKANAAAAASWAPKRTEIGKRDEHGGGKHDPERGLQDRETGKNTRHHGDAARARHWPDVQRAFVGYIERPSVLRPQHPCDEQK